MSCRSTAGMTIWSLSSLRKPPSGSGIGAPVSVPMTRIPKSAPTEPNKPSTREVSNLGKPSVIRSRLPLVRPEVSNNPEASAMASVALEPCNGMMSGARALSRFSIVRVSSVSGVTTCASPANTTMPVTPSVRASRISITFCRALRMRLGCVSVAHIDRLRSSTMTSASDFSNTGSSARSSEGPEAPINRRGRVSHHN